MTSGPPEQQPSSGRRRRPSRGRGRGGRRGPAPERTARPDGTSDAEQTERSRGRGTQPARRDRRPDPRREAERRHHRAEQRRAVVVPPISYPEELPVSARREDIAAAIRDHQVVIVAGETGSGKTTQLPKILLDLGRGRDGQIGHTQPRRIAARSVAERISEEITGGAGALGSIVGYQVRFTDQSSEQTLVKVMTDGILLAQIQRDPQLLAYDTLIIDEAHERSLNIDFILGYLTRLLPQRPDLTVVITSATIDSERFARHFAGPPTDAHPDGVPAPVIEVTGRTYPVEIRYRPLSPDPDPETGTTPTSDLRSVRSGHAGRVAAQRSATSAKAPRGGTNAPRGEERDLMTAICEAVDELSIEGPGDILVFLSGEREIRDAEEALRGHLGERVLGVGPTSPRSVELLPLYSRLSAAEQHRVFARHDHRRVVLSTNVAETSLTVPGVRYVVDPGTARISRFSKQTKVQRLPIEPVSQASANQRAGRCGRVADGIAIRLYSEADFASRPEFTEPEILRTSLASVILQMVAVGVAGSPDDVAAFPFVEPPDTRAIRDGVQLLTELGALEVHGSTTRLTETGRALALLPMDPRLARMIVEGGRRDVAREVMVIAAALSIQDPRERPAEQRPQADQSHARFADPTSDFLTYLNLWHHVRDQQRELSGSAFRRMCKAEHLNYLRLREWQDVVAQLKEMAKPLGITVRPPARTGPQPETADGTPDLRRSWDADRIHQALLAGLLSHVGMQQVTEVKVGRKADDKRRGKPPTRLQRNEYLGARGTRFAIFPGSPLSRKPPAWIMAGELVETSRLWARDVARIQPEWAEELAPHLVKRTYSEPVWSTKQGAAVAQEKVLLYGVPIVAERRVLWAKVDPEHARELFLRHALVQGEWTTHHEFFAANQRLLAEAEQVENRARRRGLVADEDALFAFYDARVPADVVSARHFDRWWKGARRADPELLSFSLDLLLGDEAHVDESQFPSVWPQGDLELALTYQFEPGTDADGVTVHIPVTVLNRVRPEGFDWLVPGMQLDLVTGLVRSLPKAVRVQLVPAPDVARDVVAWIDEHAADWADTVRAADAAPSFREVVTRAVRELRGVEVPADAWDEDRLPAHLRMTFRVHEERGGSSLLLDEGTDLVALQRRLAARSQQAVRTAVRDAVRAAVRDSAAGAEGSRARAEGPGPAAEGSGRVAERSGPVAEGSGTPRSEGSRHARVSHAERSASREGASREGAGREGAGREGAPGGGLEQVGLTSWPGGLADGHVPEVVSTTAAGLTVEAYPALVVEQPDPRTTRVSLRVLADRSAAARRHREGVRELLLGELALATGRVTTRWSPAQALSLAASPYPTTDALVTDLQRAAVAAVLAERGTADLRDAEVYARERAVLRDVLEDRTHDLAGQAATVLTAARELDAAIRASTSLALLPTVSDLRTQLDDLVHDGFVSAAGAERLPHLVRYLRAGAVRLEKAAENPQRDEGLAWQVREAAELYDDAVAAARTAAPDPDRDARHREVRWMLEELRVSLFAQQLGTAHPVSAKRIRKALSG